MDTTDMIISVLAMVSSFAISSVAVYWFYNGWKKAKKKIHQIAEFFVTLDNAVYDDKITEQEFREIYEKGKKIIFDGDE